MVIQQYFKIIGTGSYLPQRCLSAEDIDLRLGLPSGWTREQVGVETRYECVSPEDMLSMGVTAIERALADAQIDWSEIDYLIDCSTSQYRPIPCNAAHFQNAFGEVATSTPCMDVHSTCLGSILAFNVANGFFATTPVRNILLVASETAMAGVNWQQPESAALIGDGAAAVVLQKREMPTLMAFAHETYAQHLNLCKVEGGGHHLPLFEFNDERQRDFLFDMDGPALFRVAIKHLPKMTRRLLEQYAASNRHFQVGNLQVVPHQASPKACEIIRRLLDVSLDRYHMAVQSIGNLAAASIPTMLDRVRKNQSCQPGDHVMMLGTSAGYSQAAMVFEW